MQDDSESGNLPDSESRESNSSDWLEHEKSDVWVLVLIAIIGLVSNLAVLTIILGIRDMRRSSNALVAHHAVLGMIKAGFCLAFAQTLLSDQPASVCSALGGVYIVCVTCTAFNTLALVMNEAYMFSDLCLGITDSRNYCCVLFGIFIIWFGSTIMNLGVAFIPGNPDFDRDVGHCIFVYGITRNYILHVLWIVLVTMAIAMTIFYLRKLHSDVRGASYYRLTTLVRATVNLHPEVNSSVQQRRQERQDKEHIRHVQEVTRRKLIVLTLLMCLFICFWYPLFLLTITDPSFSSSTRVYKALTLVAWSCPTVAPVFLLLLLRQDCSSQCSPGCCRPQPASENSQAENNIFLAPVYVTNSRRACDKFVQNDSLPARQASLQRQLSITDLADGDLVV